MAELVSSPLLHSFVAEHEKKAWSPGSVDCCLFIADWAIWLGHSDPAAHLRGRYRTEDGFRAIIDRDGGLVNIVGSCASAIDGKRVQQPQRGDIAVIGSTENIHRQFGSIFDGERWIVRFIHSIGPMTARPLAIWRL